MAVDRRKFVKAGSALTAGAFLPNVAIAADDGEAAAFEADFEATVAALTAALLDRGYSELDPLPIVTGDASKNGGLRYHGNTAMLMPGSFFVQPVARVGDIAERGRADLLPLFNQFAIRLEEGDHYDAQVALVYELLTETCSLDPDRVGFATVPEAAVMREAFLRAGWDFDQKVLLRDPDESRAMSDGSGYFRIVAPVPFDIVTVGIYFRLTRDGEPTPTEYPPSREWTEIGEIVVTGMTPPTFGFGVERLTLAMTGRYPTWAHRIEQLVQLAEEQSEDGAIPPAVLDF